MPEQQKPSLFPGMFIYKFKGFGLYILGVNKSRQYVTFAKISGKDITESMSFDDFYAAVDKKEYKILTVDEADKKLKKILERIKKAETKNKNESIKIQKRKTDYDEWKRRHDEYIRAMLRS